MREQLLQCSDQPLMQLLAAEAQRDIDPTVVKHIEVCVYCQRRIEELAASENQWQTAKANLSSFDSLEYSDQEKRYLAEHNAPKHHNTERLYRDKLWMEEFTRQWLQPPSHPEMLGRIGRFDIERWIGSGGMGVVYKAFDTELNRPVAIKILAPYLAGIGAARQRFGREAKAAAAIVHEHVVAIHNVESNHECPYLVMQYVSGESLQQRVDRVGSLELIEILRIAKQTAAGLAAAHAQGLVHRDVKPSNILLEEGIERALLTDFGLARAADDASLTHTGYHPGTPEFMSPEQARGESVDARSDLFSLGSVIYTMCTGRTPFRAESSYGVLRKITDAEPIAIRELNPAIPEWFERLIKTLHAKDVHARFETASQVHDLLEACLAHVQNPTSVDLPSELRWSSQRSWRGWTRSARIRKGKTFSTDRWQTLGTLGGCLLIAGLLIGFVLQAPIETPAKKSAKNDIASLPSVPPEGTSSLAQQAVPHVTSEGIDEVETVPLEWDWGDADIRAIEESSSELGQQDTWWNSERRGTER